MKRGRRIALEDGAGGRGRRGSKMRFHARISHGTWQLFIANDEAPPPPCCVLPPPPGGIITTTLAISGNDIEVASCAPDNSLHRCRLDGEGQS